MTCHPPPTGGYDVADTRDATPVPAMQSKEAGNRPALPAVRKDRAGTERDTRREAAEAARKAEPRPKPSPPRMDPVAPVRDQGMLL